MIIIEESFDLLSHEQSRGILIMLTTVILEVWWFEWSDSDKLYLL